MGYKRFPVLSSSSATTTSNSQQFTSNWDVFTDGGGNLEGTTGTNTWSTLIAATTADITEIEISHNIGEILQLSTDGGVTVHMHVGLNGTDGLVPFVLAAGGSIDVKVVGADQLAAADGDKQISINGFGGNSSTVSVQQTVINDYGTTPITTGVWVQLIAGAVAATTKMEILDSSAEVIEYSLDGANAVYTSGRGGSSQLIDFSSAMGQNLWARAVSADAVVGEVIINLFG